MAPQPLAALLLLASLAIGPAEEVWSPLLRALQNPFGDDNGTAPAETGVPEAPEIVSEPEVTPPPPPTVAAPTLPTALAKCPAECLYTQCDRGDPNNGGQDLQFDAESPISRCAYHCAKDSGDAYRCGAGEHYEAEGSVSCAACFTEPPPRPCIVVGYYYYPHNHLRYPKDYEATWETCQLRCKTDPYCKFFGFWPDGGCHPQGQGAQLVKAAEACLYSNGTDPDTKCDGRLVISGPEACDADHYLLYPDVAKAVHPQSVFEPDRAVKCTEVGSFWRHYVAAQNPEVKLFEVNWEACQRACQDHPTCAHFAFWPDGGCMLQEKESGKINATMDCYMGAMDGNASTCDGLKVISGPRDCPLAPTEPPPGNCTVTGWFYTPSGTRTVAGSLDECQQNCASDNSCAKFSYWPDGGCIFQGRNSRLANGAEGCERWSENPDHITEPCDSSRVVSGPAGCGPEYYSVYPFQEAIYQACEVQMVVKNVDYDLLLANPGIAAAFKDAVKDTLAEQVAGGVRPQEITVSLVPGSVKVLANIAPTQSDVFAVQKTVLGLGDSLGTAVATSIASVSAIDVVKTGEISVGDISAMVMMSDAGAKPAAPAAAGQPTAAPGLPTAVPATPPAAPMTPGAPPLPPVVAPETPGMVTAAPGGAPTPGAPTPGAPTAAPMVVTEPPGESYAGNHFSWGWLIGALLIVIVVGLATMYGMGCFDEGRPKKRRKSRKERDADEDEERNAPSETQELIQETRAPPQAQPANGASQPAVYGGSPYARAQPAAFGSPSGYQVQQSGNFMPQPQYVPQR